MYLAYGHSETSSYESWVINSLAQWKDRGGILIKVSYNWHNVLMEHFFQQLCFLLLHWSRWLFLPIHRFSIAIINMYHSVPGKKKKNLCGALSSQRDRKVRQYSQSTHLMKYLYERKLINTSIKKSFKEFQVTYKQKQSFVSKF